MQTFDVVEAHFSSPSIGFRFVPTDEELVCHYLMKKLNDEPLSSNQIYEVNLYDEPPFVLTNKFKTNGGREDDEWYFFTRRNRKYPKGGRPDRVTGNGTGFWKLTGKAKPVLRGQVETVGERTTLDFYSGLHSSGQRTEWKMHEYVVKDDYIKPKNKPQSCMMLDDWVLCKIYMNRKWAGKNNTATASPMDVGSSDASSYPQGINGEASSQNPDSNGCFCQLPKASSMAENGNTNGGTHSDILAPNQDSDDYTFEAFDDNWFENEYPWDPPPDTVFDGDDHHNTSSENLNPSSSQQALGEPSNIVENTTSFQSSTKGDI
ncbi:hypothetical protein F3Y22_tig00112354pilonHSYRG00052 [Hibiscus syriacus]|uniref:NAC domain-containing protein n=1 Tax=Hibiscus syriacus TaxID=106335 RepID=A0A6A2YAT3_HIBSY|nr:protein ATAF2-like [Hibiscus syriacus]KAE8667874.1 hypothetical protein F3Y22_tig00112354pilonHSYRG00052 [Hibiscus syriacus]